MPHLRSPHFRKAGGAVTKNFVLAGLPFVDGVGGGRNRGHGRHEPTPGACRARKITERGENQRGHALDVQQGRSQFAIFIQGAVVCA